MSTSIQVKAFILCQEVIKLAIDSFNSDLQKAESPFYLEDSELAVEKFYDLCLPEEDETGEPDEDLPSFGKDQPISSIGENTFTLLVSDPKNAIKDQEEGIKTHIQSFSDLGMK